MYYTKFLKIMHKFFQIWIVIFYILINYCQSISIVTRYLPKLNMSTKSFDLNLQPKPLNLIQIIMFLDLAKNKQIWLQL